MVEGSQDLIRLGSA